ncbi:MAG: MFS family permease [Pseudohongiellaceae bacterium]|jgi:MFS family permease
MPEAEGKELYYGWKIVFSLLMVLTFTSGLSFYNHSVYLNALAANPAFDIQTASGAVSIFFLSGGFAGLFVAKLVQAYDPRIPICGGAVVACIALSLLPHIDSILKLYLCYAFFGLGFAGSGLIPATTLVTRWFHRRRAMALSIASTGLSLGGVVITPISVVLVGKLGFTTAAPLLGLIYLIGVIPVSLLYLRASPKAMGVKIDGGVMLATDSAEPAHELVDGISYQLARRSRFFWGITTAYVFLMMAQVGGISHQYGLVREQLDEAQTAFVVAILPISSIVGRLIGGWLVGQVSIRWFAIGMMLTQAVSLSLLATGHSVFILCLGLALFGASVGNLLMLQPLLIAEAFGLKDYAKIFSICNLMSSWGTAIGPAALGYAYTLNGNLYSFSYSLAAGAGFFGLLLFVMGGRWSQVK